MTATRSRSGAFSRFLACCTVVGCTVASAVLAQPATVTPPTNAQAAAHVTAARTLAGTDLAIPFDFFCTPGKARANNFSAPPLTPVKLFDNLYAVGNSETVVYVIKTSAGLVLLDSGSPGEMEKLVLPGLASLGLDPATIKYVLLGHGHSDHYGGAALLQNRYKARVGVTDADWNSIAADSPSAQFGDVPKPARDLVLRDGESLTLGDTTISFVEIPGHTPGSVAFIFPVRDGKVPHTAGLFGGTALTTGFITTPNLTRYITSIAHYLEVAQRMQVDVEVQNHPIFDDTPARIAALASRSGNAPHPFVMGNERYLRFWRVISECMQAELARRPAAP